MKKAFWLRVKDVMLWVKWAVIAFFGWIIVDIFKSKFNDKKERTKLKKETLDFEKKTKDLITKNKALEKDIKDKEIKKSKRYLSINKFFKLKKE